MKRLGKALALVVGVIACGSGAMPAAAEAPGAGYAKFTVTSATPALQVGQMATADIVALRGTVVVNGKPVNVVLDVAPLPGTVMQCESRACGYVGFSIDLSRTVATVSGTLGNGSPVSGTCHGGQVQLGFAGGGALVTTCGLNVGNGATGPFTLEVTAPAGLPNTAPYIGYFCSSAPADPVASCAVALNVYNPGVGP